MSKKKKVNVEAKQHDFIQTLNSFRQQSGAPTSGPHSTELDVEATGEDEGALIFNIGDSEGFVVYDSGSEWQVLMINRDDMEQGFLFHADNQDHAANVVMLMKLAVCSVGWDKLIEWHASYQDPQSEQTFYANLGILTKALELSFPNTNDDNR